MSNKSHSTQYWLSVQLGNEDEHTNVSTIFYYNLDTFTTNYTKSGDAAPVKNVTRQRHLSMTFEERVDGEGVIEKFLHISAVEQGNTRSTVLIAQSILYIIGVEFSFLQYFNHLSTQEEFCFQTLKNWENIFLIKTVFFSHIFYLKGLLTNLNI